MDFKKKYRRKNNYEISDWEKKSKLGAFREGRVELDIFGTDKFGLDQPK